MGRANIDDVGITPDAIIPMIEIDKVGYLASFGQTRLKVFHGHCIVLGVVQREVADLEQKLTCERTVS